MTDPQAPSQRQGTGRDVAAISLGAVASRGLGLIRNLVLASVIGTSLVADSYNISNALPNTVFLLLGGGTIASVFLPRIVSLRKDSEQRSEEYATLLVLLAAGLGVLLSAVMIALLPQLASLYGGSSWSHEQVHLFELLSVWCLPQLAFYAAFMVQSQILNARGRFGLVAWVPVANSLTVIIGALTIAIAGHVEASDPGSARGLATVILGVDTLVGTVLQCLLLTIGMRKAGFRYRMPERWRGYGLAAAGRMGLLTVGVGVCFQLMAAAAAAVGGRAGAEAERIGVPGHGYTAYLYGLLMMFTAFAVTGNGAVTVLTQRLSVLAADSDDAGFDAAVSSCIGLCLRLSVPLSGLLICLGPDIGVALFGHGQAHGSSSYTGVLISVFGAALCPYALHAVLIRPYYVRGDGVSPLISAVRIAALALTGMAASTQLPAQDRVAGVGVAFGLAYLLDLPLKLIRIRRRLGYHLPPELRSSLFEGLGLLLLAGALGVALHHAIEGTQGLAVAGRLALGGVLFLAVYVPVTWNRGLSLRPMAAGLARRVSAGG